MALTKNIYKTLICCLDDDEHIVENPILLPCGHNACQKCITRTKKIYECYFEDCNQVFKLDEHNQLSNNKTIETLIKTYIKDLFGVINDKVKETLDGFEELKYEEKIDSNCDYISKEIKNRIDYLKNELDNLNNKFQQQLQIMRIKLTKLIPYNEIESMRNCSIKMKTNQPRYENFYEYQGMLRSVTQTLFEFSKVNIYPFFEPSELNIENSLVGNVIVSSYNCYYLKKRILSNSLKVIDLKLKPTRLCALKSMLCITHSEANRISLISKEFELIKIIDKIGPLSLNNPTGIAFDGMQSLYICDTGNNRIILSNLKFDLIEIIDESILSEINRPTDVYVHKEYLYISDNLGTKIHKFSKELVFINSFDVNQRPFHLSINDDLICICDIDSHSSYFFNEKYFPNSIQNSRSSSVVSDSETESISPCCEMYDNEGPLCIIDNNFIQWNKYSKNFYFYNQDGKLESNLCLKSILKIEKEIKEEEEKSRKLIYKQEKLVKQDEEFNKKLIFKHEKVYNNKQKNSRPQVATPKTPTQNFKIITKNNFLMGNSRNKKINNYSDFIDDICYFNNRLVITYPEKKILII